MYYIRESVLLHWTGTFPHTFEFLSTDFFCQLHMFFIPSIGYIIVGGVDVKYFFLSQLLFQLQSNLKLKKTFFFGLESKWDGTFFTMETKSLINIC